jgi:copper chaperone CopZ
MERFFPAERITLTGNPLRGRFSVDGGNREEALTHYGFSADMPVVLVVGGSLGTRTLNEMMKSWIAGLEGEAPVQVIWQTGKFYEKEMQAFLKAHPTRNIWQGAFIERMDYAYAAADVVLSRSSLADVLTAMRLSRATVRCMKQNLFWALVYNAICIPVAAGVLYPALGITLSPMIASAAMSVSSVSVVLNSLRLRRVKLERIRNNHKIKHQPTEEDMDMFGSNKTKTVTLSVEGMMCAHCTAHVEKALLGVSGVRSATADLEKKSVTVVAKPSVSEDALKAAVVAAGYTVK